jgi:hypothetical protein
MAWLSRFHKDGELSGAELFEFDNLSKTIARSYPQIAAGVRALGRTETRRHLREAGIARDDPSLPLELTLVTTPPSLMDAVQRYGSKLGRALHYKITSKIVPVDGVVKVRGFTNAELLRPDIKQALERTLILQGRQEISRCRVPLTGQFDYRYATTEDADASAFLVTFRDSISILVAVYCDRTRYEAEKAAALGKT